MNDILIKTITKTGKYPKSGHLISHMSHVRLYGASPGRAALQIRSDGVISPHGSTSWHCISTASLDFDTARQLRDALETWIRENPK